MACRELVRQGYVIAERRVRSRLGEIDIVAWDGQTLVIVEVKTRGGARYGRPIEAVGWQKQRKLVVLARAYAARKRLSDTPIRFDVVEVEVGTGRKPRIELFRGAFDAS
jgi:putative endonuclease